MKRKPRKSPARVTLGEIAKEANVHHTTVSRALRNHPAIPTVTRERIRKIAEAMEYRPDPMLKALASYRRGKSKVSYQQNLAWLTNFPEPGGWAYRQIMTEYLQGAQARADRLGYKIEEIWFPSLASERKDPGATLLARGIRGLLIPPQPTSHTHIHLPWREFCGVSFGFSLTRPPLHSVSNFQYGSMVKLTRHLVSIGYRRPALVCSASSDERLNFAWSAGFRSVLEHLGIFAPDLLHRPDTLEKNALLRWHDSAKPDVLIVDAGIRVANDRTHPEQHRIHRWLSEEGIRIPEDAGLAVLALPSSEEYFGGITENAPELGSAAVDLLTDQLQRGELGTPPLPLRVSIEGTYRTGSTLRASRDDEVPA